MDASTLAPPTRRWLVVVGTFVAYVALARLGLLLAIPPGFASPLFPAAGLALAAALLWGWPALLAVALGSATTNMVLSAGTLPPTLALATSAGIGAGAALQAALGAFLLRRFLAQPLVLAEPRDLLRFVVLGAMLACTVSATAALAILLGVGAIGPDAAAFTWASWWVGDTLGVLIGAPVALSFIGQPHADWAPRRRSVALPLVMVSLLMGLGIREVQRLDAERQRQAFAREAETASYLLQARLQEPLRALESVRGLMDSGSSIDRDGFRRATTRWVEQDNGLQALGWSEQVARADIGAFEQREQQAGLTEYRVFDRRDAGITEPDGAPAIVIRFIEPQARNATALGVNVQSIATARPALASAARTGRMAATAGFALTQGGTGVVVYQALYRGMPTTAVERNQALRGVVFATLRPDAMVASLRDALPAYLQLCLFDNDAPPARRVLAGPAGCDNLSDDVALHVTQLPIAGRQWDVRVFSTALPTAGLGRAWPFALVGLMATALLGALLLTITGRARRIEAAVQERTADLRDEVVERQREAAERQRTEVALRESEQRLRNILDHVPIGVAYTDLDGRIREANPKLCEMLGYTSARLLATSTHELTHPDDRAAEIEMQQRLLRGEIPMTRHQQRYLAADGRTLWVQVGMSLLRDADGRPQRMVGVIEDITEHLAYEEAQRARQGAEAASRAKSDFLSRMSHELRTPLNAMLGFAQLLELNRQQPLSPQQTEWTGQIRQAGWHLLHMINDTLDLARIESGHLELKPTPLDLAEVVEATKGLLRESADRRDVTIRVRLDPQAGAVRGDATRVTQILTNLLSNAIKYNVAQGEVTLVSRLVDAQTVAIEVSDTGAGMSAAQLAQLFQPFNRLGREAGPIEGTGIGLVISLRLAEAMGGSLHARSAPGEGSTFVLELPRALGRIHAAPDDDELQEAPYRQRIVHYIEDNETNAEVMRGILALRPQVRLEVSGLGLDGLAAIRARPPSLVLLDMNLPDIDGLELLRHLQRDPDTAEIPVIVVSADAAPARIDAAVAAGAAHYLTKPVNVHEFLSVLDELLERRDTLFG